MTARIMPNIQVNSPSFTTTPPSPLANGGGNASGDLTIAEDQNHYHVMNGENSHDDAFHRRPSIPTAKTDFSANSILNNNNNIMSPHNPDRQRRSVSVSSFNGGGSITDTSPETEEFESLERRLTLELEEKLAQRRVSEERRLSSNDFSILNGSSAIQSDRERKYSTATDLSCTSNSSIHHNTPLSDRKYSFFSDTRKSSERKLSELSDVMTAAHRRSSERKLSERSDVTTAADDDISLQLVEKRQLRSFSRADEYLYAMKVSR